MGNDRRQEGEMTEGGDGEKRSVLDSFQIPMGLKREKKDLNSIS